VHDSKRDVCLPNFLNEKQGELGPKLQKFARSDREGSSWKTRLWEGRTLLGGFKGKRELRPLSIILLPKGEKNQARIDGVKRTCKSGHFL